MSEAGVASLKTDESAVVRETAVGTPARQAHLPSLDGWRAVSIALVLLCHSVFTPGFPVKAEDATYPWLVGLGFWGVRFFFVISGFLITHLLLREHFRYGAINLKNFYFRRAMRILPVCFFYLFVLGCFTIYAQPAVDWLANFTFTSNFLPDRHPPGPTHHLWSLAVEEQFYLLWPFALVSTLNRSKGVARLVGILLLSLFVAPGTRLIIHKHWYPDILHFLLNELSFLSKFDSLAIGCLAAVAFNYRRQAVENFCRRPFLACALGLFLVVLPCLPLGVPGRFYVAFFESSQAFGFAILIVSSVLQPTCGIYRALNWKWVAHLGVLSYSIYIWQQLFCATAVMAFGVSNAWWERFPIWLLPAIIAAHVSYYLLEKPLLGLRQKFRPT